MLSRIEEYYDSAIKAWPVCPTCESKITWATLIFIEHIVDGKLIKKETLARWTCGMHTWLLDVNRK